MRSYRYLHYDVFTDHLFGGNQLAVFLDARGLSAETMQAIAKEMNFSETTFVLPPEAGGTDARMRIFTPGEELPTAGHPTVGTTFALARSGVIERGRQHFVFGCNIGPVPVTMTWNGDDLDFVWMTQSLPTFGAVIPDPARTAAALSLSPAAVAATGQPVQVVSCGVPFLLVPLTTRSAVDSAVVNPGVLDMLFTQVNTKAHGLMVFTTQPGDARATVYSRMFAPEMGDHRRSGDRHRQRAARLLSRPSQDRPARARRRDDQLAGGEDGPAEPRAHVDRRSTTARLPACVSAANRYWREKGRCTCKLGDLALTLAMVEPTHKGDRHDS